MKNNITELVFILDRSGSMAGLESDTIDDFNAMIEKQKKNMVGNSCLSAQTSMQLKQLLVMALIKTEL